MGGVPTRPEHGPLKTPVEDLLGFLARPHMLSILYAISEVLGPPVRFGDVQGLVQASRTTVSRRLHEAVEAGLLSRARFDENPPRVEYAPTPKVVALVPMFIAMNDWCREHALHDA